MSFKQKVQGIFNIGNTIIQNNFQNNEIIEEYMKNNFDKIDKLLKIQEYEKIKEILKQIYLKKKDRFNENIERKILYYECLLNIVEDTDKVDEILSKLIELGAESEEVIQAKFNIAIFRKDDEVFNEIERIWNRMEVKAEIIEENRIKFLYLSRQYQNIVDRFTKEKYIENEKIKFYYAKAFREVSEYEKAKELLEEIKEKKDRYMLEYILNEVLPIFLKKRYLGEYSSEEKEVIVENIKRINKIDVNKLEENEFKAYIYYKSQMYLADNKELAIQEIKNIPERFKEIIFIDLKIDVYFINKKYDEANKLCDLRLENLADEQGITKIFNVKMYLKKWEEIIQIYNQHKKILVNNEDNFYMYGISLIESYDIEVASKIIKKECKINGPLISLLFANININNKEKCEGFIEDVLRYNVEERFFFLEITRIYLQIDKVLEVLSILESIAEVDMSIFKKYISIVLERKVEEKYIIALKIYRNNYVEKNNNYIYQCIYEIYIKMENYRNAYMISKKAYEYTLNSWWKNEYLRMKLQNKELEYIEELAEELRNEKKLEYKMTACEVFSKLGESKKAESLVYEIAYKLEVLTIEFAIRIGNMLLEQEQSKISDDELDEKKQKIEENDVIILKNKEDKIIKICLNKEKNYRSNKESLGCWHINNEEELWLELIGGHEGEEIEYGSEKYEIIEIVNKINYLGRLCFEVRVNQNIEGLQQIQMTIEDSNNKIDLSEIKKKIKEHNEEVEKIFEQYVDTKDKLGIPINLISSDILKLDDILDYLLINKERNMQVYISNKKEEEKRVVLTVVTTILLYKLNLLEEFINYYEVYVPQKLIKIFEDKIEELIIKVDKMESYLHLINDKLIVDEKNEKFKKERIKKYRKLVEILKKGEQISEDIFKNELSDIPEKLIFSADIEAIEIAKKKDIALVTDDRFMGIIYNGIYEGQTINTARFINEILFMDFNKYWTKAQMLINGRYEYFFDYETLCLFILNYEIKSTNSERKFKRIIKFILENDINNFYRNNLNIIYNVFISNEFCSIEKVKKKIIKDYVVNT